MNQYDYPQVAKESTGLLARESIKETLTRRREEAAIHLQNLDNAIKFLNENPNFESFHDLLRKSGF